MKKNNLLNIRITATPKDLDTFCNDVSNQYDIIEKSGAYEQHGVTNYKRYYLKLSRKNNKTK